MNIKMAMVEQYHILLFPIHLLSVGLILSIQIRENVYRFLIHLLIVLLLNLTAVKSVQKIINPNDAIVV